MNLKNISDQNLLKLAEKNREEERHTLTESLHYLREIESRRLFSALGFPSLFEFAVDHLRHSEDEACRRISAMRLLRDIPELETKINSGLLTLTNLNKAQTLFRRQEKEIGNISKQDKVEFLRQLEGKTKREVETIIAKVSPEVHIPDRIKVISETQVLVTFVADISIVEKIQHLKGLLAHSNPDIALGELNIWLSDLGIGALTSASPAPARVEGKIKKPLNKAAIRRAVWKRDEGKCRNCGSKYAVQIEHVKAKALGGDDSLQNLILLCRNCNQRAAIVVYGRKKMRRYLRSPTVEYRV